MNSKPIQPKSPSDTDQPGAKPEKDESVLESLGEAVSAPIFGADEEEPGEPKDRARERAKP
jgi:hypothetical protein